MNEEKKAKLISLGIKVGIPLLIAILSFTLIGGILSNPKTYDKSISYLDTKEKNVLEMTAASTAASAAITLLPGDAGTPIAEKLLDLTSYFVVISAAVLFEKYMMTVAGFIGFKILVPIAMILLIIGLYWQGNGRKLKELAARLTLFSIVITAVVPASVAISQKIEATYQTNIDQTLADANKNTEDIKNATDTASNSAVSESSEATSGAVTSSTDDSSSTEEKHWWSGFTDAVTSLGNGAKDVAEDAGKAISNAADSVANVASDALKGFQDTLNNMIEAIAVMLVTSCLIPIAVLIFLIWITKLIFGVSFPKTAVVSKIPGASKVSKLIETVEPEKKEEE